VIRADGFVDGGDLRTYVALDTDANAATGAPETFGADYLFVVDESDNTYYFFRWDGADWNSEIPSSTVFVASGTAAGVRISVNRSELATRVPSTSGPERGWAPTTRRRSTMRPTSARGTTPSPRAGPRSAEFSSRRSPGSGRRPAARSPCSPSGSAYRTRKPRPSCRRRIRTRVRRSSGRSRSPAPARVAAPGSLLDPRRASG
jgi:hypothetical protein